MGKGLIGEENVSRKRSFRGKELQDKDLSGNKDLKPRISPTSYVFIRGKVSEDNISGQILEA